MNGLLEILTNKYWMVKPDFVQNIRPVIQSNLNGHVALEQPPHPSYLQYFPDSGVTMYDDDYDEDGDGHNSPKEGGKFVAMYYVDGPVTRNGGACSYGSKDIRDMMMEKADNADCLGHVFYINTPGGSANAINDFRMGIDYARSKSQPVIAFIDGLCASAGMYLAAICDERYYMNPKDEVGCIGVMAAFYTEKNGSYNQFTNETFHSIYDPESFDKNKWVRDIADDNDDSLLVEELKRLGEKFRADVMEACPNATDDHIHGKVFDAADVEGILVDGQKTLQEVFDRVIERSNYSPNNNQMTNNYQTIAQMMEVEELVVTEEGTHLDTSLLDTLQNNIEALQAEAARVTDLTQQLADAQQALENANTAHAEEVARLNETIANNEQSAGSAQEQNANLATELQGAQDALATAQTTIAERDQQIADRDQTIAERDQQIADLNAQIEEMQNAPGNEPDAGAAPDTNGEGAQAAEIVTNAYVMDPRLPYEENMRLKKEHDAKKQK